MFVELCGNLRFRCLNNLRKDATSVIPASCVDLSARTRGLFVMVACVVDCSRSNKDILEFAYVSNVIAGPMDAKERVVEPVIRP